MAEIKGVADVMRVHAWMQRCASFGSCDPDGAHRCFVLSMSLRLWCFFVFRGTFRGTV